MSKVHVVIPAHHEEASIGKVLLTLETVECPLYVTVVCDSAQDPTYVAVDDVRPDLSYRITKTVNQFGNGALNAIKTGLVKTEPGDPAVVVMADGCDELFLIDQMYYLIEKGFDVVCASRYMRGGRQIGGQFLKKILSRGAGLTFRWLTRIGTHDLTNSFKMYSSQVLESVQVESIGGFEIGMEITVKAFRAGFKITELPTTWTERTAGVSRFKFRKWIPHYWRWYWRGVVPRRLVGSDINTKEIPPS